MATRKIDQRDCEIKSRFIYVQVKEYGAENFRQR